MKTRDCGEIVFAVDVFGTGCLISAAQSVVDEIYDNVGEVTMNDCSFRDIPDDAGIYKAKCTFCAEGEGEGVEVWYVLSDIKRLTFK